MGPAESSANGSVAAALVAAGAGAAACGVFYILGAAETLRGFFSFYAPAGPLSGVSTMAIAVWLATWVVLSRRWMRQTIDIRHAGWVAVCFLLLGLLLTFPPMARIF